MPSMFRKINGVSYDRERIELPDGDFLDVDWLRNKSSKLVIISHGLEGSSDRHYSKGMAKYFYQRGWDAVAWNCRGCSGEMNRLPRFYHHGATEDIAAVVHHAINLKHYETITLVGFSMGGSMTLKFLGENSSTVHESIKAAAVFSVPCDLRSSASELDKPSKSFYLNRFLKKLKKKVRAKSKVFPAVVNARYFEKVKSFRDFDNLYTAPLHGFKNADDFYERASSGPYISSIRVPALIVNAKSDPFLPPECYPYEIVKSHPHVFLETPIYGGHVGFTLANKEENWMEVRAYEFLTSQCKIIGANV